MLNKGSYTVQVLEVGYCNDTRWTEKLEEKQQQHAELKRLLRIAGWQVDDQEYIVLLGTAGTVYRQSLRTLQALGMPADVARQLLQKLHIDVVLALQGIIATRRQLEREERKTGVG